MSATDKEKNLISGKVDKRKVLFSEGVRKDFTIKRIKQKFWVTFWEKDTKIQYVSNKDKKGEEHLRTNQRFDFLSVESEH